MMILVGILNGYVENEFNEKRCTRYVCENKDGIYWMNGLTSIMIDNELKYNVTEIKANEISDKYAVIMNPFGETYPEIEIKNLPIYKLILDYIYNGGVFVNTAGFPFYYAWNIIEGIPEVISDEKILLPTHMNATAFSTIQFQTIVRFSGTLFYKDFRAETTYDTKDRSGAIEVIPYQTETDICNFGNLLNGIKKITEFRALRKGKDNYTPIIRANISEFGEVYPVAAIKYGDGFLLVSAMGMSDEEECSLFIKSIDAFCNWVPSQYI